MNGALKGRLCLFTLFPLKNISCGGLMDRQYFLLICISFLLLFSISNVNGFVIPEELEELKPPVFPNMVSDTGAYFEIEKTPDSEYMGISLTSSSIISLFLLSSENMVEYEVSGETASTIITIAGLEPLTKYYMYEDTYRNLTEFTTNSNGSYTYEQSLLKRHLVWIQTKPSTYFIRDDSTGGDCEVKSIGVWNQNTKTCTLTTDLNQTIEIESDNITLDCTNHNIIGSSTGRGVFVNGENGVNIKNCDITNFSKSIELDYSSNSVITNNDISEPREWTGSRVGIYIYSGYGITVSNNILREIYVGIDFVESNNNIISNNVFSNHYNALNLFYSNENNVFNNSVFDGAAGIGLYDSNNNAVIQNETRDVNWSFTLDQSMNNFVSSNKFIGNERSPTSTWLYYHSANNVITYNEIYGRRGILVGGAGGYPETFSNQISYNSITGSEYAVYNYEPGDVNAKYNWWGTTDEVEIQRKIFDYYDDNSKGIVYYSPWLGGKELYLNITSPGNGTIFNPRQEMAVEFEVNDLNGDYGSGIRRLEYRADESDSWQSVDAEKIGVGKYSFRAEASEESGAHLLSVKTDVNGSNIQDSVLYNILPTDLYIESVKAVQVVEDVDLVSDKPTVIRVTVVNTGAPEFIAAKISYGGKEFYDAETIYEKATFDFYPWSLPSGAYEIPVVIDVFNEVSEENENNNTETINVNVVNTKELDVVFRPIEVPIPQFENFEETKENGTEFLQATYPVSPERLISRVNEVPHMLSEGERIPDFDFGLRLLLVNLYIEQILSGDNSFDHVVGVVPDQIMRELTSGVGASLFPWPTVLVTPTRLPETRINDTIISTSHELGHTYGLCDEYSYCAWKSQNDFRWFMGGCPNPFPYECGSENCEECGSDGDTNINGFWVDLSEEKKTNFSGNRWPIFYNFMGNADAEKGYCETESETCRWITNSSYDFLLDQFLSGGEPLPNPNKILLVKGLVDKNSDITLDNFYIIDGAVRNLPSGDYSVELVDVNGQLLSETDFNVSFYFESEPPIDLNTAFFVLTLSFDPNTDKILFKYKGELKNQRQLSSNPPRVRIDSPIEGEIWSGMHTISWTASDDDGDSLSYVLEYSDDGGDTWQNIALDLSQTSYLWDVRGVKPTDKYKVRVTATDGVLTTRKVSGKFSVENPRMVIIPIKGDFGKRPRGDIIGKIFSITNEGNQDLSIFDVQSSKDINVDIFPPIVIPSGGFYEFVADIDTLNLPAEYSGDINFTSNDPDESVKTIPVNATIEDITPQTSIATESPPEVNYLETFNLNAYVRTKEAPLRDANITINLPEGLSTNDPPTIDLGYIANGSEEQATWTITANQEGVFEILLTAASINALDFNESVLVAVRKVHLTDLTTDKNQYGQNELIIINTEITNFNENITYVGLNLLIEITDPRDNNSYLEERFDLPKGETKNISKTWLNGNQSKTKGKYKVTAYVYDSEYELLDVKTTTFTVPLLYHLNSNP